MFRTALACLVVCVLNDAALGVGNTLHVPDQYPTIQGAIDASTNGDTIYISLGTYYEHDITIGGKGITIRGPIWPQVTIDAQQKGSVFICDSKDTAVFEYLVISGGNAPSGGGMSIYYSNPTLKYCTFTDNIGGGVNAGWGSHPTFTYCTFVNNTNYNGGGLYCNWGGNITLEGCIFKNNTATYRGGGMYGYSYSVTLTNCTLEGNTADVDGGGIYSDISNFELTDTIVCGNTLEQISGDYTDGGGNVINQYCLDDCPDLNGDGNVGLADLLVVFGDWGAFDSASDLNSDGIVDVTDLLIIMDNWGPCE